jgi:hypothetical protein
MVWWPFATKPERADTSEVTDLHSGAPPLYSTRSFENTAWRGLGQFKNRLDYVIPAWTAGIQADTDVSGRILRTWMPAIHAGMTMICIFHVLWANVRS